jgi:hypothetical protein
MKTALILPPAISALAFLSCVFGQPPEPVNVLFIAVDDLRPELGIYGNTQIRAINYIKRTLQLNHQDPDESELLNSSNSALKCKYKCNLH